jgi:acyl carrier protein
MDGKAQHYGLSQIVAEVFCKVLELPAIGAHDSFFDLGGDPMRCASLVIAVNQRFGCKLTLRQVQLAPPTVASLAALLAFAGIQADHSRAAG